MIWNGWVLGLIVGQIAIVAVNVIAFVNSLRILRSWDTDSLSSTQLGLEHRSELISTIVSWSLLFHVFSLVVFEITARSLAPYIPGAMCTVGTLHAHQLGWPVLLLKVVSLYLFGLWIVINHVDLHVEGFPLTRFKSLLMVALFPILIADLAIQAAFFTGLNPSVISSCCGVIFEVGGAGFGSSLASLPPRLAQYALIAFMCMFLIGSYLLRAERRPISTILYACGSGIALVLGTAGVIAFTAPYVYMMPALHCPFIFLDQEHYNYGYLVYGPLFGASFLGIAAGALIVAERWFPSITPVSRSLGKRYVRGSQMLWMVFLVAVFAPVVKFWLETGGSADLFQVGY